MQLFPVSLLPFVRGVECAVSGHWDSWSTLCLWDGISQHLLTSPGPRHRPRERRSASPYKQSELKKTGCASRPSIIRGDHQSRQDALRCAILRDVAHPSPQKDPPPTDTTVTGHGCRCREYKTLTRLMYRGLVLENRNNICVR